MDPEASVRIKRGSENALHGSSAAYKIHTWSEDSEARTFPHFSALLHTSPALAIPRSTDETPTRLSLRSRNQGTAGKLRADLAS